jgi:hypothetical protein
MPPADQMKQSLSATVSGSSSATVHAAAINEWLGGPVHNPDPGPP